jgi:predicted butyrate kinase (DUF1464 family)
MIRVVGVDPGTASFDLVLVEGDRVVLEESIETTKVAKDPSILVDRLESLDADYVVAPSGYGSPVHTCNEVIDPWRFAIEVLLLSTNSDIELGVSEGHVGIWVYKALADSIVHMCDRYRGRVLFIPGVIHLPTIPVHRKINRVDMGTADKLASTFLAIYDYSHNMGVSYDDVSFILLEIGAGYYAAVAVDRGRVVDGVGGTSATGGLLTAGSLDLELVANARSWRRWDVFRGGVLDVSKTLDLTELLRRAQVGEEPYSTLLSNLVESIAKDVQRARVSAPSARTLVVTGRYKRLGEFVELVVERVGELDLYIPRGLPGASRSKDAAQGYAALGVGLTTEGAFRELALHMMIDRACGTSVDYIVHPRAIEFKRRVQRAYQESVKNPKLCKELLTL